jgi:hypothetical protein
MQKRKARLPKAMREFKVAKFLWHLLIIFYLGYNTYFGWNKSAINEHEKLCDLILQLGFGVVCFTYFRPIFRWFENQAIGYDVIQEQMDRMKKGEGCGDPDCEDCNPNNQKKDENNNA